MSGSQAAGSVPRRAGLLLASSHPEPAAAVTTVSAALAASAGRTGWGVAAVAVAVAAGQLSVGWCNDYVDRERDAASGRRDKPVARGDISPEAVQRAAGIALVAVLPLSLLSGWRAAVVHCVAVALAWAYDLGLKATPWSVVPYTIAFGLLPVFVVLGLPGSPLPPWWAPLAGALLGAGAHFANTLPDLEDDLATGVRGLPHQLGALASRILSAVLLLSASVVLAFGPGLPRSASSSALVTVALVVAAGLVIAGSVLGRRAGSRAPFRATMFLALVDVVLLVARGRALA
ncbi:MAG TPA: UbiA family prenyltransferase [Frankiaceae bacterium]|jgi:4-hydroxybenzoate polyprenyltransferase|nr:UbiA family prenyltransferase [Frankiaceae bacterium]